MTLYDKALEIAKRAHKGQKRKDGEDYINHPIRVAEKAYKYFYSVPDDNRLQIKSIAVLHDVIEDSDITPDQIIDELKDPDSYKIVSVVKLLTKDNSQSYLDYILKIKMNGIAKNIKLCDIEDNLSPPAKGTLRDKYLLAKYILEN